MGPFAETCIHLRNIACPLDLDVDWHQDHWLELLGYLTSGHADPRLIPADRIHGISLLATDTD